MKSNYKRLGDYIHEVDVRNKELSVTTLVGLTINKAFIPSVANVIGTDLSNYKIICKEQFACSLMQVSRDGKMPVAMFTDEIAIMSPAYPMFEVIDKSILMPQYLMMWFSRQEFDREASFYAVGGVRGSLTWEDFCDMRLPIPSIERQREIVAEYETLSKRIHLNEQLISKLEDTAQTLYRKMFVDGIDKENLPEGWRIGTISDMVEIIDGDRGINYPKEQDFSDSGYCLFLNAGNVTSKGFDFENKHFITEKKSSSMRAGKLITNDIVFTTRGTVGNFALFSPNIHIKHMRINSGMVILRGKEIYAIHYIYNLLHSSIFKQNIINHLSGSAQPQLPIKDFNQIPIPIPTIDLLNIYYPKSLILNNYIDILKNENYKLTELQFLLLTKMGKK